MIMRRLRFCCEGADINKEAEPKEQKIVLKPQTELTTKSWYATVFPAKRISVKKMMCDCVMHCICGQCFKVNDNKANKAKTVLPPAAPTASSFICAGNAVCSCTPPHPLYAASAGNYGNETKGALCKGQMK